MASKSKRRRRVFRASCILAALIIAGSSFAWFTSKDEVTNRLSASANYGVAIAEDFQPPEKWLPGQAVNKDVGAVNTGNVDAFVRMWMDGQMRLVKESTSTVDATAASDFTTTNLGTVIKATTDETMKSLDLNYYKDTGTAIAPAITYYKTLSKDLIDNPLDATHAQDPAVETNATVNSENVNAMFNDVQTVQSGGVLVYAPADAAYSWKLEQATALPVFNSGASYDATTYDSTTGIDSRTTTTNVPKDTAVGTENSSVATVKLKPYAINTMSGDVSNDNYYGDVDASTFMPETTGLYIFRRNVNNTADGLANTYEYSGYYYVASGSEDGTWDNQGTYFALHCAPDVNGKSDYVLPADAVTENDTSVPSKDQVLPVTVATNKVYLFTATETVKSTAASGDDNLVWSYDNTTGKEKFTVHYEGGADDATTGWNDDIDITVNLANIGSTSETWTAIGATDNHTKTFYYNNDVEEGDTTRKLVDSVVLSNTIQKEAYLAIDFDLNVYLESIQVTMDETGKEMTTPVTAWANSTGNSGATAPTGGYASAYDPASTGSEISVVGWTAT